MGNKEKEDLALVEVIAYRGKDVPENYINIVRSRWIRTYKKENAFMALVHPASYFHYYSYYINTMINKPDTTVRLAVLAEDSDVVLGFSVVQAEKILHYVHVPKSYRRQRIATMLVPDGIEWITHLTKIGMRIWSWKLHNAKFNPFLS